MSDMIKAIHDDMEEYRDLCRKYGEEVRMLRGEPDCYGQHAKKLKKLEEGKLKTRKRALSKLSKTERKSLGAN